MSVSRESKGSRRASVGVSWWSRYWPILAVSAVGLVVSCVLTVHGFPCPKGDDAVYKSPAAELVQNGRLAVPCYKGFLVEAEEVFLQYPPLYQLLLAGWYAVFGVSLYSSLAFHFLVHLLNVIALMELARRLLAARHEVPWGVRHAVLLLVGMIGLGNLAYFDRPEEVAMLWLWVEILVVHGAFTRSGYGRAALSGLLIGLAALTVPWVGLLGGAILAVRAVTTYARQPLGTPAEHWAQAGTHAALAVVVAVALAGSWCGSMMWLYPEVFEQQFFGTIRYLGAEQGSGSLAERLGRFATTVFYNPPQLPATLFVLVVFPMAVARRGWRRVEPVALALLSAGVAGIVGVALLRPIAYTYLGASQMLLLGCFAPAAAWLATADDRGKARLGLAIAGLCALVAFKDSGTALVACARQPATERAEGAYARLADSVPPEDLVAVTPRHWHLFQGRNPWRDVYFSSLTTPQEVLRCEWMVLTEEVGKPPFIEAFQKVDEVSDSGTHSYGYSLWRRRDPEQLTRVD
jgi:hypothetical protein